MSAITSPPPAGTTLDPTSVYEVLPRLLADAALNGIDIGDLLGHACSEGTRLLPKGMDLTTNRSGSWEASHIEALTHPDAVTEGPGAQWRDVDCDTCGAGPGGMCWNPRIYADNKHPHPARVELAAACTVFLPGLGWLA